ncbi:L,D-transpeptidase [Rhodovulum sp. YNF3179]|uniref:L,D-transpeptidase n=1 Tax=Rhodovulum sp. YNF3179 TaxID=3425127 RepID=UPI003D32AA43
MPVLSAISPKRLSGLVALCLGALIFFAGPSTAFQALGPAAPSVADHVVQVETKRVPRSHGPQSREIVSYPSSEPPGTIIISNSERTLHRILGGGKAERYKISVGRDGFTWTGTTVVGRKAEWPAWRPPADMRKREPDLPSYVPPGPYNPLGARAIYLFQGGRDTLYRIHGTNDSSSLGGFQTSGCFRLSNADVMELFGKVRVGTKVIVRP